MEESRNRRLTLRARRAVMSRVDPIVLRRAETLAKRRPAPPATRQGSVKPQAARVVSVPDAASARKYLDPLTPSSAVDSKTSSSISHAFTTLYQPDGQPASPPPPDVERAIVDQFHRLYYHVSTRTWKDTTYRGIVTYKCPTDMWVYAELLDRLRPGLVVETGTFRGGSALFLADICERNGHGRVVSIDIDVQPDRPEHARLDYLTGSSTADEVLSQVRDRLPADGSPVLVILDSDHSRDHVAAEIRVYAPMVTLDSYLVVEDSNVNGHPAAPSHGPGPWEAAHDFLAGDPGFEVDHRCERYGLTQNPDGYLRRIRA